ncbi:hypothetical protein ACFXTO_030073 [Malus domestica]
MSSPPPSVLPIGNIYPSGKIFLSFPRLQPDPAELQKLQAVEKYLKKCIDSCRVGDWRSILRECDSTIASGADSSPQTHFAPPSTLSWPLLTAVTAST